MDSGLEIDATFVFRLIRCCQSNFLLLQRSGRLGDLFMVNIAAEISLFHQLMRRADCQVSILHVSCTESEEFANHRGLLVRQWVATRVTVW